LRYEICGLSFDSAEPFPELEPLTSPSTEASLRLRKVARIEAAGAKIRPAIQWSLPNGNPLLVSTKTENGYLLQFEKLADFFIDQSGTEVLYCVPCGVPANSVRHLLLDNVIAFVLSLRGHAVLHSSAIVTPFGACAFAATTGVGKSTLAASFQHEGYMTLTDDCLLLDAEGSTVYGIPSYPGVRLREDSLSLLGMQHQATLSVAHYNSKRRLAPGQFATGRNRLRAIYCLQRSSGDEMRTREPHLETVSGRESLLMVLRYMFCLDPHEPAMLVRQFKMLEQILSQVRILRLTIPDDFSALPRVHKAVLEDLRARTELGASAVQ
jgi:hypothetical protein